jgi:hypothetical protein
MDPDVPYGTFVPTLDSLMDKLIYVPSVPNIQKGEIHK